MKGIVWGATSYSAIRKLQEIEHQYENCKRKVLIKRTSKYYYELVFDNGDHWIAVAARENQRGRRCNISYIDINIDDSIIDNVIRHCTTVPPY